MNVLVLGYGLLGKEIVNLTNWSYISRSKDGFDIEKIDALTTMQEYKNANVIINCVAYTDTYSQDKEKNWNINYRAVSELVKACNHSNKKLVHISTDYVYSGSDKIANEETTVPVHNKSWYGYTKLISDAYVQLESKNYLLIRCSHKPNPFPYKKAWIDQTGNFDYANVIAKKIVRLVRKNEQGTYNVGTELKSMIELAERTSYDVESSYKPDHIPSDVSMDLSKLNNAIS